MAIDLSEARKIALEPNTTSWFFVCLAMKCLEASDDEFDRDMLKRLKEIYYDIPDGCIIGTFSNNSGGKPSCPSDFPLYHWGEWRKYRTTANGWAYGGEICVLIQKENHRPDKNNELKMSDGGIYTLSGNRKFRVWGVAGSPSHFDGGGVCWVK